MSNISLIFILSIIIYYINSYEIFRYTITDEIIDVQSIAPSISSRSNAPTILNDYELSMIITEYYNDLNTYFIPTNQIIPVEVYYDEDGLSFSKTIYECVDYYYTHHTEIMKNTKHMKIIIINVNEKSYCLMNTDLIV